MKSQGSEVSRLYAVVSEVLCGLKHCVLCKQQEFEDSRDADDAVYDLNGKLLCGERSVLSHFVTD